MIFNITKKWAVELILLEEAYSCAFDFGINLTTPQDVDFAYGFNAHIIIAGYTIIEFAVFGDGVNMRA